MSILLTAPAGVDFNTAIGTLGTNLGANIGAFVDAILPYSRKLAVIIVIFYIAIKVFKMLLNPDNTIVPHILIRPCLILGALVLYKPLVDLLVTQPINIINDIIEVASTGSGINVETTWTDAMLHVQDSGGSLPNSSGIYDILQANPTLELIHLVIYFIASIAGAFIEFMHLLVVKFYFILGTLALPLGIIPGNTKVVSKWFFGLLSVMLWMPILSIIKAIIAFARGSAPINFADPLFSVAYQVVLIVLIFSIPKLANILVSQGSELGESAANSVSSAANRAYNGARSMMKKGGKGSSGGTVNNYGGVVVSNPPASYGKSK